MNCKGNGITEGQNYKLTSEESDVFYCVKAFAILSVIAAHVNQINSSSTASLIVTTLWELYSKTGVVCFFYLSGFFFQRTQPWTEFWKKKVKMIIIPWIVCGIGMYCLISFLNEKLSIAEMFGWILGYGTWFYYITVLLALYVIFGILKSYRWLYFAMIMTLFSVAFHDIFGENSFEYLNIFNWCGFFALGQIVRKNRIDRRINNSKGCILLFAVLCLTNMAIVVATQRFGYFHITSLAYEVTAIPLVIKICSGIQTNGLKKHLLFAGRESLFIYLVHMPIVQAIGTRLPDGLLKHISYPAIAFEIMVLITWVLVKIADKNISVKKIVSCIGIRI